MVMILNPLNIAIGNADPDHFGDDFGPTQQLILIVIVLIPPYIAFDNPDCDHYGGGDDFEPTEHCHWQC